MDFLIYHLGVTRRPIRATRYSREIPSLYRVVGANYWQRGLTINISESGVLLQAASPLALHTRLEMTFQVSEPIGTFQLGQVALHWGSGPSCPADRGKSISRRRVLPACAALNLANATWLTFRRTYSSWAHDKGVPAKVVAQLLGHAKVDTTLNVYTQVLDDSLRTAVEAVGIELFRIVQKPENGERANSLKRLAPQVGLEPTTLRLTAGCSTIELLRNTLTAATRWARRLPLARDMHRS